MPEELEKHLILNLNRLRTSEDARLDVTYVEVKFGLRIRASKPSDTGLVNTQTPWMLMRSILSREERHRVRMMGVSTVVEQIFNETAVHARTHASNRLAKANRASHDPCVRAKVRI